MRHPGRTLGHQERAAGVRRFRAQLLLIAVVFSSLLYAGLYTQLRLDAVRALETEGASYVSLLVNVGEWTAWHSSGELLSRRAEDGTNVSFHLADLDAGNPAYHADAWEAEALAAFYSGSATSDANIHATEAGDVFRYIEAVRIREDCLTCHAGYTVGEPRGAISVEVPMDSVEARMASGRVLYGGLSIMTLIGMLAGGGFFLGRFQRSMDAANERLEEMAVTDDLTGAPNRRAVLERLNSEVQRSRRTGEPLSIILVDVDHFKHVNDTMGHAAGDAVLAEMTRRAQESLRSYDTFGRMGGEEFLVVAPGTAPATAERLTERLLEAIRAVPVDAGGRDVHISASAGVATLTDDDAGFDALLARADEALYRAKEDGRDRFVTAP